MNTLRPVADAWRPLFKADWRGLLMMHFALPPEALRERIPLPLDTRAGDAYITLVAFRQERLRFDRLGALGRLLALPVGDHAFLNARTYVRHGDERGIYFIEEYIDNPAARAVGPALYGLPYRLAKLKYEYDEAARRFAGNVACKRAKLSWATEYAEEPLEPAEPGSEAHFLHERYLAFTHRHGALRRFRVQHEPWRMRRASLEMRVEDESLAWLGEARFAGAWYSPLLADVGLGAPERLAQVERAVPARSRAGTARLP